MNILSRQVKFLSQSSDRIKNYGAKNGQILQKSAYLCNIYFTLRKGEEGHLRGFGFFPAQKMPFLLNFIRICQIFL